MSNFAPLKQIADHLAYAAGEGAHRLAAGLAAAGTASAQTSARVACPGPGLTELVGHQGAASARAEYAHVDLGKILSQMNARAVDAGVSMALRGER